VPASGRFARGTVLSCDHVGVLPHWNDSSHSLGSDRNPDTWTDQDKGTLMDIYIQRRNNTNMTDSQNRADRIRAAVTAGLASDKRGSFT